LDVHRQTVLTRSAVKTLRLTYKTYNCIG
jgi:hypothetical protein